MGTDVVRKQYKIKKKPPIDNRLSRLQIPSCQYNGFCASLNCFCTSSTDIPVAVRLADFSISSASLFASLIACPVVSFTYCSAKLIFFSSLSIASWYMSSVVKFSKTPFDSIAATTKKGQGMSKFSM